MKFLLVIAVLIVAVGCGQREQSHIPAPQHVAFGGADSLQIDLDPVDQRLRLLHEIGGSKALTQQIATYPDLVLRCFIAALVSDGLRSPYPHALADAWERSLGETALRSAMSYIQENPSFIRRVEELTVARKLIARGDGAEVHGWYFDSKASFMAAHPFWSYEHHILGRQLGHRGVEKPSQAVTQVQRLWMSSEASSPRVVRDQQGQPLLQLSAVTVSSDHSDVRLGIGEISRSSYRELGLLALDAQQGLLALTFLARAQMGSDDDDLRWLRARALHLAERSSLAQQVAAGIEHPGRRAYALVSLHQGPSSGMYAMLKDGLRFYDDQNAGRQQDTLADIPLFHESTPLHDQHDTYARLLLAGMHHWLRDGRIRQGRELLARFDSQSAHFSSDLRQRAEMYRILLSADDRRQQQKSIQALAAIWRETAQWDLLIRFHQLIQRSS